MRGIMRRLIEVLFPIQRYVRLRREIGLFWALAASGLVLVATGLPAYLEYMEYLGLGSFGEIADALRRHGFRDVATAWGRANVEFLSGLVRLDHGTGVFWGLAAIMTGVELGVALFFVRARPGRRRPLCTWQTVKYVLLGGWSWFLLIALDVTLGPLWAWLMGIPRPWESVALAVVIVSLVGVPLLLVGATAALAANAVVALQDDRKCVTCGYFLIGLSEPRCPECGSAFDPNKLATLGPPGQAEVR
ncbi:MAG: BCD family MFS transporter [Planctomycetes bacterium]|nr:BCD family MFS transporter [Planctomycetota bacterium]